MSIELHFWMIPALATFAALIIGLMPSRPRGGNLGSAIGNAAMAAFSGLLLIVGLLAVWLVWAVIAIIWRVY